MAAPGNHGLHVVAAAVVLGGWAVACGRLWSLGSLGAPRVVASGGHLRCGPVVQSQVLYQTSKCSRQSRDGVQTGGSRCAGFPGWVEGAVPINPGGPCDPSAR